MNTLYDAVVIGGGPAGLSAALTLGRSCRRVLVASAGPLRNAPSEAAHNILTHDGTPPAELVRIGREQLAPYDVHFREEWATDAEQIDGRFAVTFAGGERVEARAIILAMGMRDVLPDVPGFKELWGSGVFHCPYCHGWEVAGRRLAIYANGEKALHFCRLLIGWTDDLVLFSDGPTEFSADDRANVERNGIILREERVVRLVGSENSLESVELEGGDIVPRDGLFAVPKQELPSDLPQRLGCKIMDDGRVEAEMGGRSSVPRVFVAGDAGPGMQSVVTAMSSGMLAGAVLNHDLLEEEFGG